MATKGNTMVEGTEGQVSRRARDIPKTNGMQECTESVRELHRPGLGHLLALSFLQLLVEFRVCFVSELEEETNIERGLAKDTITHST